MFKLGTILPGKEQYELWAQMDQTAARLAAQQYPGYQIIPLQGKSTGVTLYRVIRLSDNHEADPCIDNFIKALQAGKPELLKYFDPAQNWGAK